MVKTPDGDLIEGRGPQRVVVLIDASPDALHALEAAVDLARRHDVPLLAVSVEEPDRVRSAGFPFAREVGAVSGSIRPLGPTFLDRRRDRVPAAIRRAVERTGRAASVAWELIVVRGRLIDEVLALSQPGDCLMLGRVGWSVRLGRTLGRAPLTLARRAGGTVYICSAAPLRQRGRVAVLIEDIESAGSLLALAAGRARVMARGLVVLLAPGLRDAAVIDDWARATETAGPRRRFRKLPSMGTGEMLRILAEENAIELVAGRSGQWLASPAAARLLAHWRMPVLIVPGPEA